MKKYHAGKLMDWFEMGHWVRVMITSVEGFTHLLILNSAWTQGKLISEDHPRLLGYAINKAKSTDYLTQERVDPTARKHRERFQQYQKNIDEFYQDSDLVLRSLTPGEEDEVNGKTMRPVRLYLHDSIGRSIPFFAVVDKEPKQFKPVKAYCVFKQ